MSEFAVKVEHLWKEYVVEGAQQSAPTLYDLLSDAVRSPLRRLRGESAIAAESKHFWALRDVTFEIPRGEVFGIVGRNGAGKSTLLKILSRITAPSRGRVTVRGKLASLLEVGTGFHPELTGRENIYLNATILGMQRAEIDRKLEAIVAFAGVERFIDMPVKKYSSGMYVRLAFSVAAHVDADILLVDEVLAVGDAEFQKRCLGLMGDVARGGRTVFFVSHNLTALRNLCTTGLLLQDGQMATCGPIGDVLNAYASTGAVEGAMAVELPEAPGNRPAWIRRVAILPNGTSTDSSVSVSTPFAIEVQVDIRVADADIGVYVHCQDSSQNRVFSTGSFFNPALNGVRLSAGRYAFSCDVPADLLNEGQYTLDVMLVRDRSEVVASESSALSFTVHGVPTGIEGWNWPIDGVVRPRLRWTCNQTLALAAIPFPLESA